MRRYLYGLGLLFLLIGVGGCQAQEDMITNPGVQEMALESPSVITNSETTSDLPTSENQKSAIEESNMTQISITLNNQTYEAMLYDNETTRQLIERLPLTLSFNDLYGNEKYHYLSESLPTHSTTPQQITKGDMMLYGTDCLVIFYDTFKTSYSYTPLGYIVDRDGLTEALASTSNTIEINLSLED